jgi:hypothetical protein
MMRLAILLRFIVISSSVCITTAALAIDIPTEPHTASSELEPYAEPPKPVELTPKEMQKLKDGSPIYKHHKEGKIAAGTATIIVKAPIKFVWQTLLRFKDYPKLIGGTCKETKVLEETSSHIRVGFEVGMGFISKTYFIDHTLYSSAHAMTWTLDLAHKSQINGVRGAWVLTPNPDNENETRVDYFNAVELGIGLSLIENWLTRQGLRTALGWLPKQSELAFMAHAEKKPEKEQAQKVKADAPPAIIETGAALAEATESKGSDHKLDHAPDHKTDHKADHKADHKNKGSDVVASSPKSEQKAAAAKKDLPTKQSGNKKKVIIKDHKQSN